MPADVTIERIADRETLTEYRHVLSVAISMPGAAGDACAAGLATQSLDERPSLSVVG